MPAVRGEGMRGLAVFISDIRNCKSKEAEVKRINKELANIRNKFKGDKTLDGYQKKKYVCKLLFIFLLGHDIDFGHMEAVNLLSSNKYSEKQIGYLFISVLMNANSDLMKLIVQSIKNDLNSRNPIHVNLALQCIANIGSREMAESFGTDVPRLLVSAETQDVVKQSAALCLLRLFQTMPELTISSEYTSRIIHLLNDQHMGVVTAAVSLINTLATRSPEEYKVCISLAVSRLTRIVPANYTDFQDYSYYFVPAPWLSVKLLRLLQIYPSPEDSSVCSRLHECLETILNKAQEPPKSKKVQHSNAKNAILFEAISLIIHMDNEPNLLVRACNQLGQFLQHRETNLRYLALESMCLLATSEFSHDAVKKHQDTVINALKTERDVSVRQRAVDLLYAMCDRSNAEEIVAEMLSYLETADYSIREEMVLKVAILAEKYATDLSWYVDVILNLIRIAGDYVSEEVWYRVIQIVVNREDVQGYAAKTCFEALQAPACHENMVKVAGYILGEFGNLIAGDSRSSPLIQFQLLNSKYHLCSTGTRALLLTAYVKFINLFPEIKTDIETVLKLHSNIRSADAELQQRTVEYLQLSQLASPEVLAAVLEEMPVFPERESSILATLKKKKPAMKADKPIKEGKMSNSSSAKEPADLLGFASTAETSTVVLPSVAAAAASATAPKSNTNLLIDIFGDIPGVDTPATNTTNGLNGSSTFTPLTEPEVLHSNEECLQKLLIRNNGILYENSIIQIGVKSEYKQNMGKLSLFYGNKSSGKFTGFTSVADAAPTPGLVILVRPVDATIENAAQIQQQINVECVDHFDVLPAIIVQFNDSTGKQHRIKLQLPVTVNKFFNNQVEMDSEAFFQRWKNLNNAGQESQKIFKAAQPIDNEYVRNKLVGFGFNLLVNVDPNPENFVCAAIFQSRNSQVGCLLRLEPNKQAQMYRLTVRSSKDVTSERLTDLLVKQF